MSHPGVEPRWGNTMAGPTGRRIGFECPQCHLPVYLTPVMVPDISGGLLVQPEPLVHAIAIHMRVGCKRRW